MNSSLLWLFITLKRGKTETESLTDFAPHTYGPSDPLSVWLARVCAASVRRLLTQAHAVVHGGMQSWP